MLYAASNNKHKICKNYGNCKQQIQYSGKKGQCPKNLKRENRKKKQNCVHGTHCDFKIQPLKPVFHVKVRNTNHNQYQNNKKNHFLYLQQILLCRTCFSICDTASYKNKCIHIAVYFHRSIFARNCFWNPGLQYEMQSREIKMSQLCKRDAMPKPCLRIKGGKIAAKTCANQNQPFPVRNRQ